VNQIYFSGSYALKGLRIGVVAGMIGLTVRYPFQTSAFACRTVSSISNQRRLGDISLASSVPRKILQIVMSCSSILGTWDNLI
jgi:hypothetical protein